LFRRKAAFTLLELLVVMAIVIIVISLTLRGIHGVNSSGKFNKALGDISGILEQGRAYAIAQNTYVWVAFYETNTVNNTPREVFVGMFSSNDGTDPFEWTGTATVPSPALTAVTRLYHFTGLHLQTNALPGAPAATPNFPASAPVFQCRAQGDSGPLTLSDKGAVYWVVQFTPTGAVRNGANPIDAIWLGLQPSFSQNVADSHNVAAVKVNGLTGLTTIHRP
jgi:type II secretory pathway pseudopilin PulG